MIKRKNTNKFILLVAALLLINMLPAQTVSPFNRLEIKDTSANYTFIVSGHFHGSSTNTSTFPAATLLANIDTLNAVNASFLLSLGDLFLDVNDMYIDHYQKSLFNKLKMPMFNVVGNHDLANGNMYEKVYGKTFFSFTKRSELYILLNTEVSDGSIKNEQLTFLKNALQEAAAAQIKNVFIFSHRPVWSENNVRYKDLFRNNTHTSIGHNNFEEEIKPLLAQVSKTKNIYWISGSMAEGPASFFYDKDPATNITFMQTAIRNEVRDAALLVSINNGVVKLDGISFTGQKLEPIENYGMDYWNKNTVPDWKFSYRLIPYMASQMLKHYFFWTGVIVTLLVTGLFSFVRKRMRRKKPR